MIHYFVKLNAGVVVNASHILHIRRLETKQLMTLTPSQMDMLKSALDGTGVKADKYYTYAGSDFNIYEANKPDTIVADLPDLCVVTFNTGSIMYATAERCSEVTGILI